MEARPRRDGPFAQDSIDECKNIWSLEDSRPEPRRKPKQEPTTICGFEVIGSRHYLGRVSRLPLSEYTLEHRPSKTLLSWCLRDDRVTADKSIEDWFIEDVSADEVMLPYLEWLGTQNRKCVDDSTLVPEDYVDRRC